MAKQTTVAPSRGSRQVRRPATRKSGAMSHIEWGIPLGIRNLYILGAGIIVIVIGYILMGTGIADNPHQNEGIWNRSAAVTIAPILLGIGYCVIVPFALLYRPKKGAEDSGNPDGQ